jgi:hypothetical protein
MRKASCKTDDLRDSPLYLQLLTGKVWHNYLDLTSMVGWSQATLTALNAKGYVEWRKSPKPVSGIQPSLQLRLTLKGRRSKKRVSKRRPFADWKAVESRIAELEEELMEFGERVQGLSPVPLFNSYIKKAHRALNRANFAAFVVLDRRSAHSRADALRQAIAMQRHKGIPELKGHLPTNVRRALPDA